ncbi:hypothetical protein KIH39_03200 [Telmatocola sphagniphila]|uniref:DUF4350 domain-containing protein n=1 Tax=Telmatocola sphagniphila TaxID=1123043 RepID=A0A8E6B6T3_9BACT|nr:hypothetical protein [Telmatocola sphagniphila]QVL32938.1 hypothetical protein KIH39_03200 [Telmatocola sphagniphila]
MISRRWMGWTVSLLLWASSTCLSQSPTPAAENKPLVLEAQGTDLFKWVLHQKGLRPIPNRLTILTSAPKSVIIMMGDVMNTGDIQEMQKFVALGGSLLFVSDHNCEELVRTFGLFITGRAVLPGPQGSFPGRNVLNPENFPLVSPVDQRHLTAASECFYDRNGAPLRKIVTTIPSSIRRESRSAPVMNQFTASADLLKQFDGKLYPLAGFYSGAKFGEKLLLPEQRIRLLSDPNYYLEVDKFLPKEDFFAFGGELGSRGGKAIFLSDQDVFFNQLMVRKDTDNYQFAEQLVDYLINLGRFKREYCYFSDNTFPEDNFDLPLPEMPLPPLNQLGNMFLQASDQVVSSMEEKDFFNTWLKENIGLPKIYRGWWLFAIFGLFSWILWRFFSARSASARGRRQATRLIPYNLDHPGEQLEIQEYRDNYYSSARNVIRSSFARIAETPDSTGSPSLRQLRKHFAWYQFGSKFTLRRLWLLAYEGPQKITARKFQKVLADLNQLERRAISRSIASSSVLPSPRTHVPQKA